MKTKLFIFVVIIISAISCHTSIAQNNPPPLLDRELFFGDPQISGGQLSPDGAYISFMKPYEGTRNLWVKKLDADFSEALPVTNRTERPISGYFWSRDGKYILFVMDQGGDENYNIYALDPSEAKPGVIPQARNLTNLKEVRAIIYHVSRSNPDLLFVGINDRDKAWHDLYQLSISTGELKKIRENTRRYTTWIFDNNDLLRLAIITKENGDNELWRLGAGRKEGIIYQWGLMETAYPIAFNKENNKIYFVSNKGDVDKTELYLMDVNNGKTSFVEKDPENKVDFGGLSTSEKTLEVISTSYTDDYTRIYFKDKTFESYYNTIKSKLGDVEISFFSANLDESLFLIAAYSDVKPSSVFLFNTATNELTFQYAPREGIPTEYMASMKPIHYPSSDGLMIPAYLTLPKGMGEKKLPLVVMPHGGPWARDYWGFNTYCQFLANRGYAVLIMNFRGSTGFGKSFLNAGNKQWGELMQDDITWGVKYLVEKGIADPKRVAIFGGSYGGYATLAGLTFTPDIYACGVSFVGPSNLLTLLNSIPPYWESSRKVFHERMGNPSSEEGKKLLVKQSPLFSAHKIKVPLMVVQGQNDPRVKKTESDQIVIALRDRGFAVEYLNAPDEGHGFARPENNIAFVAAMEKFLAKHIGGRYQSEMPEKVEQRLKEITVDVASVTLPAELSFEETGMVLSPVRELPVGSFTFDMVIDAMGQEIKMQSTVNITKSANQYVITEETTSPMGKGTDEIKIDARTFNPISRNVNQGPVTLSIAYSDTLAEGTIINAANTSPISVGLDAPLFAEGPGWVFMLAALPLSINYKAVYRNLNLNTLAVKILRMNTVSEILEDGTKTWRLDIEPADGSGGSGKVWVDAKSFKVIKFEQIIPEMAGAKMTGTLVK